MPDDPKKPESSERKRIQFDLTEKALAELDKLKEQADAATRAELVRTSLRLYAWFLQQRAEGYDILLRKGDSEVKEVELFV